MCTSTRGAFSPATASRSATEVCDQPPGLRTTGSAASLAALNGPLVEVHLTNIHAREEFRHHSYVSAVADGVIADLGVEGYVLALQWLALRGVR